LRAFKNLNILRGNLIKLSKAHSWKWTKISRRRDND